jgi:hypothetical protein
MTSTSIVLRRWVVAAGLVFVAGFALPVAHAQPKPEQKFPDVIGAKVTSRGGDRFDFDVTISSRYDTAARYADAFRVLGADRKIYGERVLLHDHADEQPFTRDLYGVAIPADVKSVTIEGRDQTYGWGGKTFDVVLPGR